MRLITKKIGHKMMAAYEHSAKTGESGKEVLAKYFTPWANATWYITEGMPVLEDGSPVDPERFKETAKNYDAYDWHLFGFGDLGDRMNAELGYVMLSDLHSEWPVRPCG
jgi:hypothetical protein